MPHPGAPQLPPRAPLRLVAAALALAAAAPALARAQEAETATAGDAPQGEEATEGADPWSRASSSELRDHEARQLFEAGRLAFADGRFEDALSSFRRAYELSGRALLLFNIGASFDRLRRNREALDFFARYLDAVPDAENRLEVEGRMQALRAAIDREDQAQRDRAERDALLVERDRLEDESSSVWTQWWLWTLVGAAVAGGVLAVVLLSSGDEALPPIEGNVPGITMTLRAP